MNNNNIDIHKMMKMMLGIVMLSMIPSVFETVTTASASSSTSGNAEGSATPTYDPSQSGGWPIPMPEPIDISTLPGKAPPCGILGDIDGDGLITQADRDLAFEMQMSWVNFRELTDMWNLGGQQGVAPQPPDYSDDTMTRYNIGSGSSYRFIEEYLQGIITTFPNCAGSTMRRAPCLDKRVLCYPGVPCLYTGDANYDGYITQADVDITQQIVNGTLVADGNQARTLDVNGDGVITQADVDLIQQFVDGVIDTFPYCVIAWPVRPDPILPGK